MAKPVKTNPKNAQRLKISKLPAEPARSKKELDRNAVLSAPVGSQDPKVPHGTGNNSLAPNTPERGNPRINTMTAEIGTPPIPSVETNQSASEAMEKTPSPKTEALLINDPVSALSKDCRIHVANSPAATEKMKTPATLRVR